MCKKVLSILLVTTILLSGIFALPLSITAAEVDTEGVGASNPYDMYATDPNGYWANCTYWAWQYAYDYDSVALPGWSHGGTWYASAQRAGFKCDKTPSSHSIMCTGSGTFGHVAYVTEYNSSTGQVYVKQGGWRYSSDGRDERWTSAFPSDLQGYIHLDGNDTEPPVLSNVYQDGFTNIGYTLHFTVTDNVGLKYATIYTNVNGENRKEENINLSGIRQEVSYTVRYSDFNTDSGYRHGIWVYDMAGNKCQSPWIEVDSQKPTCENAYINYVTQDSYRVNIVPKDNIGIDSIIIATWSQSDQSDLKWNVALDNGYGTYFFDINRADYSATQNSYYFNHAYIYDTSRNLLVVSCPQDYKIVSDTGKIVPEGEYRIVTAVNENRALDVANGSSDSGANIRIYNNFVSPKQTFKLVYQNNGFYTISNTFSNCLLDVAGDTYLNNTNVIQCTANGGPNQDWMIKPSGDGYYYIISRTNGLALDVTNAKDEDGANVAVHSQNHSTAQKWKLRRVINDNMVKVNGWKQVHDVIEPNVTVIVDETKLTENTDFTVSSYIENEKLYARITGIGNYCDSVTIEYQEIQYEVGDTNFDGKITIGDVTAIQRHLAELGVFTEEQLSLADTNGDGKVDISDATYLQKYLAEFDGIVLGKQAE